MLDVIHKGSEKIISLDCEISNPMSISIFKNGSLIVLSSESQSTDLDQWFIFLMESHSFYVSLLSLSNILSHINPSLL